MSTKAPITPQQADREAAADLLATLAGDYIPAWQAVRAIRAGEADNHRCVTAFAHHAQQARLEERERAASVAERMYVKDAFRFEFGRDVADAIRKGEAQ